ncbi:MAG: ABC transporter ATP-binding protein [Spirochaetaceae bacterium]|nr:ABC transporter ATP-binding protein [Spirochaetaceae bacterium]
MARGLGLVFRASGFSAYLMFFLTATAGLVPVGVAWTTKLVVDTIGAAASDGRFALPLGLASGPGGDEATRVVIVLIAALLAIWIVDRAIVGIGGLVDTNVRLSTEHYIHTLLMRTAGRLDLAFYENPEYRNMLERATQGAIQSSYLMVSVVFQFIRTALQFISFALVLTGLHWLATVLIVVVTAPQMVATGYHARRQFAMHFDLAEDSRLRHYVTALMSERDPAKEIRLFGLLDYLIERFSGLNRKFRRREIALRRSRNLIDLALGVVTDAGAAAIWIYVGIRALNGQITIGDVVLFTTAVASCKGTLIAMFQEGGMFYQHALYLGSLFSILDLNPASIPGSLTAPESAAAGGAKRWGDRRAPRAVERGIEFRGVSFRYPGTDADVLHHLSFTLQPGESVALVGRNGSGKTTAVKLLTRLYDPTEGRILLDGHDLKEYDLESLHRTFGVIFQDFVRYALTARENVGFGDVDRVGDAPATERAARKSGIHDTLSGLEQGYETYLGRQFGVGTDLSGGEWQRVGLSRAYMRDAGVLILDEPTASLDAFAEFEVFKAFSELMSDRISVVISHRFSNVRLAEHIIVLDDGRVAGEGNHEELMAAGGLYAEMFDTQAEGYR